MAMLFLVYIKYYFNHFYYYPISMVNLMSKVSFIASKDRKYNVARSLSLIKSDVLGQIKDKSNIVIKPYFSAENFQLTSTYAESVEALLDLISPHISNQITMAGGCPGGDTLKAFKNYDYFRLQDRYDFAIVDLNHDSCESIELKDSRGNPWKASISQTLVQADCILSVCPPRIQQEILFSGGEDNLINVSSVSNNAGFSQKIASKFGLGNNKDGLYRNQDYISENFQTILGFLKPCLSIIDGYAILQGEGISPSELAPLHWAISSVDFFAADLLASQLLGLNFAQILYLHNDPFHSQEEANLIVGDDWKKHISKIRVPKKFEAVERN